LFALALSGAALAAPFLSAAPPTAGTVSGRAAPGAVIFLEHPGVARDPVIPKRATVLHVSIRAGRITPHVSAAPLGSHLAIELSDVTVDDVAAYWGLSDQAFRRPFVAAGDRFAFDLTRPGLLTFENEEQPGRFDYVYVAPTNHFTVADESGNYLLDGIRAGAQSISAWNERDGLDEASVNIPAGGTVTHDFFTVKRP
jgi:hypothetical protein